MYEFSDEEESDSFEKEEEEDSEASEEEDDAFNDEAVTLRNELADIPLGELKELKNQIGLKKYNEVLFGSSKQKFLEEESDEDNADSLTQNKRSKQKHNGLAFSDKPKILSSGTKTADKVQKLKSEPMEYSSKKFLHKKPRVVVKNNKQGVRDPRFSDLSGQYNEELFEKSYSFVQNLKDKEYEAVKKQLKKSKGDTDKQDGLIKLKQKLDSDRKRGIAKQVQREKIKERKSEEIGKVKKGKKAFYLKKSDQKKIELAEKFRELKSTGKYDNYMKNKRKRKATKEKKMLPNSKITFDI